MEEEIVRVSLVLSLCVVSSYAAGGIAQAEECPLWTVAKNDTDDCVCAQFDQQTVRCNTSPYSISVRLLQCMTADTDMNPIVGPCLYNSNNTFNRPHVKAKFDFFTALYRKIVTNYSTNLNTEMCGSYKRKGLMCGQCIKDYGLPVYSYNLSCVKCVDYKYNWLKYIAVAYLPLTVFFLIIITFKFSANSSLLIGYITVSQMNTTYSIVQSTMAMNLLSIRSDYLLKIIIGLYSIWNLDFFRSIYPPFCLHPNMSALGVLSLDYLVAIYPMVAVILTYIIVQKFSYVSCLSGPLKKCLHMFIKEGNTGSSLIESFATFILLSYVKILNVTFNILTPTYLYNMNGTYGHPHVYYDPHTEYLSKQHLPYFVLAIVVSFVFNFLPFLLICFYSCACFQKFLNFWTGLRHPALSIFMDAFHGSYRDKPSYLRSFPAIYFMAQFTNLLILATFGLDFYFAVASLNLMVIILLIVIAKPYKNKWHNVTTLTLFSSLFIQYTCIMLYFYINIAMETPARWLLFLLYLSDVAFFAPPLYGLIAFIGGILPATIIKKVKQRIMKKNRTQNDDDALLNRFKYCHESTPLICDS